VPVEEDAGETKEVDVVEATTVDDVGGIRVELSVEVVEVVVVAGAGGTPPPPPPPAGP